MFESYKSFLGRFIFLLSLSLGLLLPIQAQEDADFHVVVLTHGQVGDAFWDIVKAGVNQATLNSGLKVDYRSPSNFDMTEMAAMIDAAVLEGVDGLIISIPDPVALGPAVANAVAAGIPVISINSGSDVAARFGVIAHIGQTEYEAGFAAGTRMAEAGVVNAICVNQEVGNIGLDLRCQGFTDGMAESSGRVRVLAIELTDPSISAERVGNILRADETIDGMLTLGPSGLSPALAGARDAGRLDNLLIGTFDLSPEILQSIQDEELAFAIDQQPYLQGYLSVTYMMLYLENLNTPGSFLVLTGPGFVTIENVEQIIELSAQGTR